jgi:uncharacterized protein DUF3309
LDVAKNRVGVVSIFSQSWKTDFEGAGSSTADKQKNCHFALGEDSVEPMHTILIIILIILLIGALPTWPYSSGWGYYPSGGLGLILLIVLILWLMGGL